MTNKHPDYQKLYTCAYHWFNRVDAGNLKAMIVLTDSGNYELRNNPSEFQPTDFVVFTHNIFFYNSTDFINEDVVAKFILYNRDYDYLLRMLFATVTFRGVVFSSSGLAYRLVAEDSTGIRLQSSKDHVYPVNPANLTKGLAYWKASLATNHVPKVTEFTKSVDAPNSNAVWAVCNILPAQYYSEVK